MIGIVGFGTVGSYLARLFRTADLPIVIYDKHKPEYCEASKRDEINRCDGVFVAVPTPTNSAGCDLSNVEECVSWILPPICIKSTIIPGTTDRLCQKTGKKIIFSPEYIGETPFHKYRENAVEDLVAFGGEKKVSIGFLQLYKRALGPEPRYFMADALTVELAKYMENCFFATKVAFVSQFYLLADRFGADFYQMREIWVADSRIGRSHSTVIDEIGFGGRCLPKDLDALISAAKHIGGAPLLEAVAEFNKQLRMGASMVEQGSKMRHFKSDIEWSGK